MTRKLTFTEAINEAMILSMKRQKNIICYGLGVDDPKRIFNTTKNLKEMFGSKRVFDVPASENALTGIGIGSSLNGLRPVMVHQRLDFFLYAMDQLINGAEIDIPTLSGKIKMKIPSGLASGQILRIKGKGFPYINFHIITFESDNSVEN